MSKASLPEIGVIVHSLGMYARFDMARSSVSIPLCIELATPDSGIATARRMIRSGVKVLVSRGSIAHNLRHSDLTQPVIEVHVTGFDTIRLLREAGEFSRRVAVVAFDNFIRAAEEIAPVLGLELMTHRILSNADIERGVRRARQQGFEVVLGGDFAVEMAKSLGLRGLVTNTDPGEALRALQEAERMVLALRRDHERALRQQVMLDSVRDAIISFTGHGAIMHCNRLARKLLERRSGKTSFLVSSGIVAAVKKGKIWNGEIVRHGGTPYACTLNPVREGERNLGTIAVIQNAKRLRDLEQTIRNTLYPGLSFQPGEIIGASAPMREARRLALRFGKTPFPVCIEGESGTGKELFAEAVHAASHQAGGPFVPVNCAAIPESLLESELFGYAEGAFTGARKGGKPGLFETAHNGTLFLDEVGEMSPAAQARLLRVLEESRIRRLGDSSCIPVRVRLVCASNRDLRELVRRKRFRQDVYFRLNVLRLRVPPLRERGERDIRLLIRHFLESTARLTGIAARMDEDAAALLAGHDFPGNVRELRNLVERLCVTAPEDRIRLADVRQLLDEMKRERIEAVPEKKPGKAREEEQALIQRTLNECGGNKAECARRLGLSPATLWRRLRTLRHAD